MLRSDSLEQLADGLTVTLRTYAAGEFNPETGKTTAAHTDTALAAIRGMDEPRWLNGAMRITRVYQVTSVGVNPEALRAADLIDGTEQLQVLEYRLIAGGRMYQINCGNSA